MTAEPLELAGLLIACGGAAAGILMPGRRWQPLALGIAAVAAPLLVAGDVWDQARIADLRSSPALVAGGAAALAVAVSAGAAIARRWDWAFPVAAIAALALRLPLRIGGETSNLLVPLYLVIASGLVAMLWARVRGDGADERAAEPRSVAWLRRLLAMTVVLYAIQASYSVDVSNAIENACFFLVPFAILFCQLSALRWDRRMLTAVLVTAVSVGVVLAAIGIGQYVARDLIFNKDLLDSNQIKPFFRVNSLFHDPNVLGRYLALGVIAAGAGVAWSRGGRAAIVGTIAGVVMLAGLALSFSITSIAAMIGGLGVLALLRYGLRGAVAAGLAVVLTGIVFALSGGFDRPDIGPTRGFDEETSGRGALLEGGFELIEREPLVGWGSGSFGRAFFDEVRKTETTASHSEPITVAAEQGVPGTALYVALLGTMLWALLGNGVRSSGGRASVAAGIVAMVVHSLGYAGFLIDPATWALLAIAAGARRLPPIAEAKRGTPAGP